MYNLDDFCGAVEMDECGKPVQKVMAVTTGMLTDEVEHFNMAVVIDEETGKPMPKVHVVGGGGGVDLTPITSRLDELEYELAMHESVIISLEGVDNTYKTAIHALETRLKKLEALHTEEAE